MKAIKRDDGRLKAQSFLLSVTATQSFFSCRTWDSYHESWCSHEERRKQKRGWGGIRHDWNPDQKADAWDNFRIILPLLNLLLISETLSWEKSSDAESDHVLLTSCNPHHHFFIPFGRVDKHFSLFFFCHFLSQPLNKKVPKNLKKDQKKASDHYWSSWSYVIQRCNNKPHIKSWSSHASPSIMITLPLLLFFDLNKSESFYVGNL